MPSRQKLSGVRFKLRLGETMSACGVRKFLIELKSIWLWINSLRLISLLLELWIL